MIVVLIVLGGILFNFIFTAFFHFRFAIFSVCVIVVVFPFRARLLLLWLAEDDFALVFETTVTEKGAT